MVFFCLTLPRGGTAGHGPEGSFPEVFFQHLHVLACFFFQAAMTCLVAAHRVLSGETVCVYQSYFTICAGDGFVVKVQP